MLQLALPLPPIRLQRSGLDSHLNSIYENDFGVVAVGCDGKDASLKVMKLMCFKID